MSWQDRIIEGAFNSPSGERLTFKWEDFKKSFTKKGTAFTFPDAPGTFVQDFGRTSDKLPIRAFFTGPNCDLEAEAFEDLVSEQGIGRLEHPMHGIKDVVVIGEVNRRDDLKTAANQVILELVFWETVGLIYPSSEVDPSSTALSILNQFNLEAAEEFADGSPLDDVSTAAAFVNTYNSFLDNVNSKLGAVASFTDGVKNQFDSINNSINQGITTLVGTPLLLASQTLQLIQAPARAVALIGDRLEAYKDLLGFIIDGGNSDSVATFRGGNLVASAAVSSMALSAINNDFNTKAEALEAAQFMVEQMEALNEWQEQGFVATDQIDVGESYQQLQQLIALTAGFLVEISFSLKQERRLILDRSRTIVDLVAELYGSIDDQLDFFINSNDLSGSEILELPAGKEVLYYV
jgi:prophage DNA circulation protein